MGFKRWILRGLAFALSLWLVLELASWIGLWILQGERPSWGRQAARQEIVLGAVTGRTAEAVGPPGDTGDTGNSGGAAPARVRGGDVPHPYVGFVPSYARPEDEGDFTGLSDRLLGDPSSPCYRDEPFVVGICGGSVAAGVAVNQHAYLVRALAELPEVRGREVFVVRFAIPGFKQPQQLGALAYLYSLGVRFDLVVNLDGFNEIVLHASSNRMDDVFFAYPREWSLRHRVRDDVELFTATVGVQALRADRARTALDSRARWSFFYQLGWHFADGELEARYARLLADAKPEVLRSALKGPLREYASDADMYDDLTALWRRSSLQMNTLCAANGAAYVHLLQPNQYVAGSKTLAPDERAVAWNEASPYREAVAAGYPRLIAAGAELARAGVQFHDLTGLFDDVEPAVYRDDCCHFNLLGNQMLSEELVRIVAEVL